MFINEVTSEEKPRPICPVCSNPCTPDQGKTSNLFQTPKGLAIIHTVCAENVNSMHREGMI